MGFPRGLQKLPGKICYHAVARQSGIMAATMMKIADCDHYRPG